MDRLCQENAVDPARAGAGNDIRQHPQAHAMLRFDAAQQIEIDALGTVGVLTSGEVVVESAAGGGEFPQFLGDAVHVDGKADPAVTDQSDP